MLKLAPPLRRPLAVLALTVLAASPLVAVLAAQLVYSLSFENSDFFTFWLGGRMNWTGHNPYSIQHWVSEHYTFGAEWVSDQVFPYPLPLATLMAPLGLLPLDQAYIVWVAVSAVLLVVTVFVLLLRRPEPRLKHYLLPLLAGIALFRPVWVTLRNGQLGAVLLFALVVCALLWEEKRWFLGGLVGALLALKPTLGLPILGLMTVWLFASRHWRALAGLGTGLAVLVGIGLARDPGWLGGFMAAGQSKLETTFGYAPSLWGMASAICRHEGSCAVWLGGLAASALAVAAAAYLLKLGARRGPLQAAGLAVVVALLVTPYVWGYDQVLLLLPITLLVDELILRSRFYLLNALAFLALDIGAIALLALALQSGEDVWSGLVPLAVGLALMWPRPTASREQALTMTAATHP